MPVWVELRRADSTPVRSVDDPSGGKFDADGDFDRFIGSFGRTGGRRFEDRLLEHDDTDWPEGPEQFLVQPWP